MFRLFKRVKRLEDMLGWLAHPNQVDGVWQVTMDDLIRDFKDRHELKSSSRYWVKKEDKPKDE